MDLETSRNGSRSRWSVDALIGWGAIVLITVFALAAFYAVIYSMPRVLRLLSEGN